MSKELYYKVKCLNCVFLDISTYSNNDKKFTCKKNWFGGTNEPSKYGLNLCKEKKDFKQI